MPTTRLIPSAFSVSNSSYVTVTDPNNMYNTTDNSSAYATLQGRSGNRTAANYVFINGFNFSEIPNNAVVSNFIIKIKAYRSSNQRTGTSGNYDYRPKLSSSASNSDVISGTELTSDLTTTAAIYTIPTGSLTWNDICGYGSGFSIEIPLCSTSGAYPRVYMYGAEIEVTYTIPEPPAGDTIFIKVNGSWVEAADVKVKDNGTWQSVCKAYKNVNGSWVEQSDKSAMFDPNALYLKG